MTTPYAGSDCAWCNAPLPPKAVRLIPNIGAPDSVELVFCDPDCMESWALAEPERERHADMAQRFRAERERVKA